MIRLPGLIDPHVHLREPGAEHKEDFSSGTSAALAGGFTLVLAMPNTQPPLTTEDSLKHALQLAGTKARCDYGLYLGAGMDNENEAAALADYSCGLKLYMDATYGPLRLADYASVQNHLLNWPRSRAAAAHAESRSMAAAILAAAIAKRPIHICHVSRKEEIELIRDARRQGFNVTCEVTPHHLFFTEDDLQHLPPGCREVRPVLATKEDQEALWDNLDWIDCFATDHAPHTIQEKSGDNPPPGFPGLETSLGLFLTAVHEKRLTMDQVLERMVTNPRRIFGLPEQPETWIEVDEEAKWEVHAADFHSRCGWTPFEGLKLHGRVRRVVLRGKTAVEDGVIQVPEGYGRNLFDAD